MTEPIIQHRIVEITSISDPRYDDWLDIYQQSFPLNEQMLVSEHNKSLRSQRLGAGRTELYLCSINEANITTGIARLDTFPDLAAAYLPYLAVSPNLRGGGLGSWIYGRLISRLSQDPTVNCLVFEVESPIECEGVEAKSFAERRIAFYKRQGAKLLAGIRYIQSVGWQPPMPMNIMVHALGELSPDEAVKIAEQVLETEIERVGALGIV